VLIFLTGLIHLLVILEYHGFAAYLGLPGLPSWEPFTEPSGLVSLVVEAIFVGLAAYVLAWRRATPSSGEAT
jgi:hypothetical protein